VRGGEGHQCRVVSITIGASTTIVSFAIGASPTIVSFAVGASTTIVSIAIGASTTNVTSITYTLLVQAFFFLHSAEQLNGHLLELFQRLFAEDDQRHDVRRVVTGVVVQKFLVDIRYV
jgi:hypothetical protein